MKEAVPMELELGMKLVFEEKNGEMVYSLFRNGVLVGMSSDVDELLNQYYDSRSNYVSMTEV